MVSASESAGQGLGTRVVTVRVRDGSDVIRALSDAPKERIDGVIVDLAIRQNVTQILELASRRRLPTVSSPREFAVDSRLLAYGAHYPDLRRRTASDADRIQQRGKRT